MNTTDEYTILENVKFEIEPLKNYVFYNRTSRPKIQNDPEILKKLLDTSKTDIDDYKYKAKDELIKIFENYQNIFHMEGETLSSNNFYKQHLKVSDNIPVYIKNYRLPHAQCDEIHEKVQELFENDIIEDSNSAYNSPLLIVPKKS